MIKFSLKNYIIISEGVRIELVDVEQKIEENITKYYNKSNELVLIVPTRSIQIMKSPSLVNIKNLEE